MLDFNDAPAQMGPMGELIPDGTFAKLQLLIRRGGADGSVSKDAGLLKASNKSDVKMLDCEFVVLEGPFAKRRFWNNFVVDGGKRTKSGESMGWNITKSSIRAMLESFHGIDPKDTSDAAKQKRSIASLSDLDGVKFVGRIMVNPATSAEYNDQNGLANVVVPSDPQYKPVMKGEEVPPEPVNAKPRKSAAAQSSNGGGWQGQAPAAGQGGGADDMPVWAQ